MPVTYIENILSLGAAMAKIHCSARYRLLIKESENDST